MSMPIRGRLLRLLAILLVMTAGLPGLAQKTGSPAGPRKILMWKATSPTTTVYLLGSIHVGDSSMYPMPPVVEAAFAGSKVLAVEVNLKTVDQSKAIKLVQDYGLYTGNDVLSQHVSKETAAALNEFCDKNGFPKAAFEKLKPWVAAVTVIAIAWKQAGEDPALGVDQHFLDESKSPQRIEELETAELQMSILSGISEQEQQDMLAKALQRADKTRESMQKMQAAYLAGDSDALLSFMNEQDGLSGSLRKKLLDDRNLAMAERMDAYLKGQDPCFVVVGAAHLLGEQGLVKLLQAKGYRVEQISAEVK